MHRGTEHFSATKAPALHSYSRTAWMLIVAQLLRDPVTSGSAAHGPEFPAGWTGREELKFVVTAVDRPVKVSRIT